MAANDGRASRHSFEMETMGFMEAIHSRSDLGFAVRLTSNFSAIPCSAVG
jgi:hypothetical protein